MGEITSEDFFNALRSQYPNAHDLIDAMALESTESFIPNVWDCTFGVRIKMPPIQCEACGKNDETRRHG